MNVLIVHAPNELPLRPAIAEHLYAIERNSNARCFYFDPSYSTLPAFYADVPFDLIVYHTTFLSTRWMPERFRWLIERTRPLRGRSTVTVAWPQDEFIHTLALSAFLNEFAVDHVFSVMPPTEWPAVYRTLERREERLRPTLTGFLSDGALATITRLAQAAPDPRPIDVGYRAYRARPWLGSHGMIKTAIADRFLTQATGLRLDISTSARDTILGDDWYRFLLGCCWTIGVEGGSSLLDEDGALMRSVESHLAQRPAAPFAEVEQACFPGQDGRHHLVAISPRHLEACATRTAQVLVRGEYNGILAADRHYLPLRPDLSDLSEIVPRLADEGLRRRLADACWQDVVASGRYTYRRFVEENLDLARQQPAGVKDVAFLHARARRHDRAAWAAARRRQCLRRLVGPLRTRLRTLLAGGAATAMRRLIGRR